MKLAKAEDVMCHLWKTGRLSGHPHEDGHYDDHDKAHPTPAAVK